MRTSILFTLSIVIILLCGLIVSFFSSPIPASPYFERHKKNTIGKTLMPGQIYQQILRQLDTVSGKGQLFGVFFHGDRNKKRIALTFDADMTSGMFGMLENGQVKSFYDKKLIEELRRLKTPATLFLAGMWVEKYPEETANLASDPLFELGSHSYSHKAYASPCYSLERLAEDEKIKDIGVSQFLIEQYTKKRTTLFRFPGGCFGPGDLALIKLAGARVIAWDIVADDGFNSNEKGIVEKVASQTKNGSIIVMHMNGFPNEPVDYLAVPKIIEILRAKGFEFVTVSTLFDFQEN